MSSRGASRRGTGQEICILRAFCVILDLYEAFSKKKACLRDFSFGRQGIYPTSPNNHPLPLTPRYVPELAREERERERDRERKRERMRETERDREKERKRERERERKRGEEVNTRSKEQ